MKYTPLLQLVSFYLEISDTAAFDLIIQYSVLFLKRAAVPRPRRLQHLQPAGGRQHMLLPPLACCCTGQLPMQQLVI